MGPGRGVNGTERVKVLHLITHLGVGGATDNTLMTVAGHRRDRYEVHLAAGVLSADDNYAEWGERAEASADALFYLPDLRRDVTPLQEFKAIRALVKLIREQKYDIVHTHCSKAGFLGRIAARRAGCPIVVHTCHAFGWQVAGSAPKSLLRRWLSSAARRVFFEMDRYAATLSDSLITVSDLNKDMAVEVGLAPLEKFTTIHSGIDLSAGDRAAGRNELCESLDLDPARPILGTVGRLATQKDPVMFVQAAKLVLGRRPDVQFVMIGNGPLEVEVRDAIGGESAIRMLGHREDVRELLTLLDAFILSSRWEGLGRALTEAVGTGIPVAATEVDGIPELITHGVTGRLSPPGDPRRLAENILWILEHRDEALEMAARAQTKVLDEWGADQMVKQIEALYEQLLHERVGCTPPVATDDSTPGRMKAAS
jgi:glycosyltransferase involved in cell wall biosynthesis